MTMKKIHKLDRPQQRIKCIVDSCYYYMSGDHCGAEMIEVHARNADSSEDTYCETFVEHS